MNIGIDFNMKTTKAAFLANGSKAEEYMFFEIKNMLAFINGDIFVGTDGYNKFIIEKSGAIYELDQIIEQNGLIVNKKQISPEKCLSLIFAQILSNIKAHSLNIETGSICVCVSIPYDKYYYWHGLMEKAFSLIGIEKVRVVSQPAAFFGQPDINHLHTNLNQESLQNERQAKSLYIQAVKKYEKLLLNGALISIDKLHSRIRVLPLTQKD